MARNRNRAKQYYIKTTGGNAVYRGNEEITVQISPESYLRKRVEDLNTGEIVVYNINSVNTTLEDIEDHLYKSPLYARAEKFVLEKNSRNTNVPKLRIALMHSLLETGHYPNENLEAIIMKEVPDFSKDYHLEVSEYLRGRLINSPVQQAVKSKIPQEWAISHWLRGLTVAPQDHTIFKILQYEFGNEFTPFISDLEDMNGFYKNYRIRNVVRQNVMRTLNNWRGIEGDEESTDEKKESKIKVSDEVALIRSHFLKDITEELKGVMVTGVGAISKEKAYNLRRVDKMIGNGIVREGIETVESSLINIPQVLDHEEILNVYLNKIFSSSINFPNDNYRMADKRTFFKHAFINLMTSFGEPLDIESKLLHNIALEGNLYESEIMKTLLPKVKEGVLSTNMDSTLKFKPHTISRLLEGLFKSRKSLPDRYYLHWLNSVYDDSILKKHNLLLSKNKLYKCRDYLAENYQVKFSSGGIIPRGSFLTTIVEGVLSKDSDFPDKFQKTYSQEEQVIRKVLQNGEFLHNLVGNLAKGKYLFTREYTSNILREHGLEEIIDIKKDGFILETLNIPFPKPPKDL